MEQLAKAAVLKACMKDHGTRAGAERSAKPRGARAPQPCIAAAVAEALGLFGNRLAFWRCPQAEAAARRLLGGVPGIAIVPLATNDVWVRDWGPSVRRRHPTSS
jgi:hypothetical protein